ncbi:MAG: cytochrome b/b6 domain-containing protein [Magnetococcales bacterium]|nr:cytochrome b/b6 domain-containing protein [Magnetococcales bacterium]
MNNSSPTRSILLWDIPTRLFHWSLVLLMIGAFITANQAMMERHALIGQAILSLIIYRILWGFVGGETTRFRHFVKGPKTLIAYLVDLRKALGKEGEKPHSVGHNPAGGLMILLLLLAVLVQAVLGLFSNEDTFLYFDAPLVHLVGSSISNQLTAIHKSLPIVLLILVATHVGAALSYLLLFGDNLIWPMITGQKKFPEQLVAQGDPKAGSIRLALLCLGMAILLVQGSIWILSP